jgi:putative RNA 2'-phosphotransferase
MRALYGHSLHLVEAGVQRPPPPRLFHGTSSQALNVIRHVGLIPVNRRYLHLTSDIEYASRVASRFNSPVVLIVLSAAAADTGIVFHQANSQVG